MADLEQTLKERGERYGKFTDHARIAQDLKVAIGEHIPGCKYIAEEMRPFLDFDQAEALDMICHKIGCILAGDPNYADSWHDIAGYAKLVADRLEGEAK